MKKALAEKEIAAIGQEAKESRGLLRRQIMFGQE